MADWADEIADALLDDTPDGVRLSKIAAALRKAKADGYRLAYQQAWDDWDNSFGAMTNEEEIERRAAEIEKGNA